MQKYAAPTERTASQIGGCPLYLIGAAAAKTNGAVVWGAVEAYRQLNLQGEITNSYLICYAGLFFAINFDWEPTPEQITAVCQKINP